MEVEEEEGEKRQQEKRRWRVREEDEGLNGLGRKAREGEKNRKEDLQNKKRQGCKKKEKEKGNRVMN